MIIKQYNIFYIQMNNSVLMPSINAMSADITVENLKLNYGGVMPNWQEFTNLKLLTSRSNI